MPSSRNGFIMLYVNGQSFGQTEFRYDVAASLRLFEALMTGADYYAPDLLTLDAEEFRELVDGLHDDHPDPRFEKLWHHFEKIDERLIVRLDYAFDQCLIGIAASDVEERIFAIDPDGNRSEARTLPLGTIRSLVSQARTEWDSLNGSRLA